MEWKILSKEKQIADFTCLSILHPRLNELQNSGPIGHVFCALAAKFPYTGNKTAET